MLRLAPAFRRWLLCALLMAAHGVYAQPPTSPVGQGRPPPDAAANVPRFMALEERLSKEHTWTFYHTIRDVPADLRDLLFRVAGKAVVGPGEEYNDGDILSVPSSTQHQFTAASSNLVVIVWYSGGFSGPELHVLLYDPAVHDGCRYVTTRPLDGGLTLTRMADFLHEKQHVRVECFAPDAL